MSRQHLKLYQDMCTVLRQYLNQNPDNPLNDMRKPSPVTSPVLMHFYIPPSKMDGGLNSKGKTCFLRNHLLFRVSIN